MGTQTKEVGGGPATGLANDFVKFLQNGLNSGTFGGMSAATGAMGANPVGSTQGIAGILNDILSGGGGKIGGSFQDMITKQEGRDVNALRARFGQSGGTAFGTPGAYAESLLRSETAPKLTSAIGNLQLSALQPLMQIMEQISGRGISQRETVQQPSQFGNIASIAAPIIGSIAGGPLGGMIGSGLGNLFGPHMPGGAVPNPTIPGINIPGLSNLMATQFPNSGFVDPRNYGGNLPNMGSGVFY